MRRLGRQRGGACSPLRLYRLAGNPGRNRRRRQGSTSAVRRQPANRYGNSREPIAIVVRGGQKPFAYLVERSPGSTLRSMSCWADAVHPMFLVTDFGEQRGRDNSKCRSKEGQSDAGVRW